MKKDDVTKGKTVCPVSGVCALEHVTCDGNGSQLPGKKCCTSERSSVQRIDIERVDVLSWFKLVESWLQSRKYESKNRYALVLLDHLAGLNGFIVHNQLRPLIAG